jgi:hypothetical protein
VSVASAAASDEAKMKVLKIKLPKVAKETVKVQHVRVDSGAGWAQMVGGQP